MSKIILVTITLIFAFFFACSSDNPSGPSASSSSNGASGDWEIPTGQIYDGGPGKDGIPALSSPQFLPLSSASFMNDNELIIGIKSGDEIKAYPHHILDWHEIINDDVENIKVAITYCPLTGSGIGWNRVIEEQETTFGVSGLLFNSNLIPYDRATDSNWSQMQLKSVNGKLSGQTIDTYPVIETKWSTWKKIAPNSEVVSRNTGYNRSYGQYPYGDYRSNHNSLIFPVNNGDNRLQGKERIHGIIINAQSKAYRISSFNAELSVLNEQLSGESIVVAGSSADNFVVSYKSILNGDVLTFKPVIGELPIIMQDDIGNKWDIFGHAVSGPFTGQNLTPVVSFNAYWFAWAAFYPSTQLFK
jgi:hypothetical protein